MEDFQKNILKVRIFSNTLIFQAIVKILFEVIHVRRVIIPVSFVLAFPFSNRLFKAVTIKLWSSEIPTSVTSVFLKNSCLLHVYKIINKIMISSSIPKSLRYNCSTVTASHKYNQNFAEQICANHPNSVIFTDCDFLVLGQNCFKINSAKISACKNFYSKGIGREWLFNIFRCLSWPDDIW